MNNIALPRGAGLTGQVTIGDPPLSKLPPTCWTLGPRWQA